MNYLIYILCGFLFFQDLKFRKVNLYIMVILFLANLFIGYKKLMMNVFSLTFMNIVLIIFLILSLYAYYSLKKKKLYNIADKELGKGDIFMLLTITPSFLSFNFLIFIITSITISILIALFMKIKIIPFAGLIALTFIGTTLLRQLEYFKSYSQFNIEHWI